MTRIFAYSSYLAWLVSYASILPLGRGHGNGSYSTHGRFNRRIYDPGICWESWGFCPPITVSSTSSQVSAFEESVSQRHASSSLIGTNHVPPISSTLVSTSQRLPGSLISTTNTSIMRLSSLSSISTYTTLTERTSSSPTNEFRTSSIGQVFSTVMFTIDTSGSSSAFEPSERAPSSSAETMPYSSPASILTTQAISELPDGQIQGTDSDLILLTRLSVIGEGEGEGGSLAWTREN